MESRSLAAKGNFTSSGLARQTGPTASLDSRPSALVGALVGYEGWIPSHLALRTIVIMEMLVLPGMKRAENAQRQAASAAGATYSGAHVQPHKYWPDETKNHQPKAFQPERARDSQCECSEQDRNVPPQRPREWHRNQWIRRVFHWPVLIAAPGGFKDSRQCVPRQFPSCCFSSTLFQPPRMHRIVEPPE